MSKLVGVVSGSQIGPNKGSGNEREANRLARLQATFSKADTKVFYNLGNLLALGTEHKGKVISIAAVLKQGGKVEIDAVPLTDGRVLEVNPPQEISLSNVGYSLDGDSRAWTCPACGSAHGLGTHPTKDLDAVSIKGLLLNQFYYSPARKQVFAVSTTCMDKWFHDLKVQDRFVGIPAAEPVKA